MHGTVNCTFVKYSHSLFRQSFSTIWLIFQYFLVINFHFKYFSWTYLHDYHQERNTLLKHLRWQTLESNYISRIRSQTLVLFRHCCLNLKHSCKVGVMNRQECSLRRTAWFLGTWLSKYTGHLMRLSAISRHFWGSKP